MEDEKNMISRGKRKITEFNIHRKVFVGNVSYRIKSRKLTKFFSKFGAVECCCIVKDHISKRSRGIAFVTFKEEESVQRAIQASEDELFFDQRQMRVKPAELSPKVTYWQNNPLSDDEGESDIEEELGNRKILDHTTDELDPNSPCLIDKLFDDVLLRIFSLLSWKERIRIERVCWRWKNLIQRSWVTQKHMHFQNIFRQFQGLTDKMLNSALSRFGQYLESLDLSASPRFLTDFSMNIIAKYCPEIKELDLSSMKLTDVSIRNLVSGCTNLRKIKLKRCLHITDKGVNTLLMSGQPLSHLDISDISQLSGKCFRSLQNDLDSLKILVLTDCYKLDDNSINNLATHSKNMEELYINNCRGLTGICLQHICKTCSHLRVLHAAGVNFDTDALEDIKKLEALEDLNLSLCQMVTDRTLLSVSEGCKRLRYLDIGGCHGVTDIGVMSLIALPHLETINLSYLNQVTEDSVIKLAQGGSLVKFVARATQFPRDDVIITLVALCPRLNHIDLSGCFQVTNKIFDAFKSVSVNESDKKMDLILGGTSVDWLADDVDWIKSGFGSLAVSMHNLAIDDLRADGNIVLPSYEENWEDEADEYPPHPPISAYQQGDVEMCNDWCDDDDDDDDFEGGFLDNDDPLEYERWSLS